MAIGWWTALKVIPWDQVIQHAPGVLKGARRLMEQQRGEMAPPPAAPVRAAAADSPVEVRLAQLEAQLSDAQARLARLTEQQRQGDELLAELAEQNARLVQAVNVLRLRSRLLIGALVVLAGGTALLAWRLLGS